jgi:hypothetical protein
MTTFTSEDRISSSEYFSIKNPWPTNPWFNVKDYRQTEIEFFFPLTEQIPLGLDYTGCGKPKVTVTTINGVTGLSVTNATWSTNISPTLSVQPQNSVGQLNIGGISVGLEKQPKWHQKVLFKLLGFNWKDR